MENFYRQFKTKGGITMEWKPAEIIVNERVKESYRGIFIRIPLIAQLTVIMLIAFMLYQMSTTEILPFIYFRF